VVCGVRDTASAIIAARRSAKRSGPAFPRTIPASRYNDGDSTTSTSGSTAPTLCTRAAVKAWADWDPQATACASPAPPPPPISTPRRCPLPRQTIMRRA